MICTSSSVLVLSSRNQETEMTEMLDVEKVVFVMIDGTSFEIPIGLSLEKDFLVAIIESIRDMWLEEHPSAEIICKKEM